jgi:hypothetical protein
LEVRDIGRPIDEHIFADKRFQNDKTRLLCEHGCASARFYCGTEKARAADKRYIRHAR